MSPEEPTLSISTDLHDAYQTAQIEVLSNGQQYEKLLDGRVMIFRGSPSSSRAAVDAFYQMAHDVLMAWPAEQTILAMFDFRKVEFSSPYQMSVGPKMLMIRHELPTYFALLLQNNMAGQVGKLAVAHFRRPNGTVRAFFHQDEAVHWLLKVGNLIP